jgi:hypothetical protein
MKHGIGFTTVAVVFGAVIIAPALNAQGRQCSGNGDVIGSFGFSASRSGFALIGATAAGPNSPAGTGPLIPVGATPPGTIGATIIPFPVTPPGTTAATVVGSNTSIGHLLAGIENPNVFSSIGRVFADGMGNLYSSPTNGLMTNILVGSYNVTTGCYITMTLTDPFVTTSGSTTVTTSSTGTQVTLDGFVSLNGSELDMVGFNGALITFKKTAQAGNCDNTSLSGNYTVIGNGFYLASAGNGITTTTGGTTTGGATGTTTPGTTTPTPLCTNPAGATTTTGTTTACVGAFNSGVTGTAGTPFTVLGRFVASGNGILTSDAAGQLAPVGLNITGSYSVSADCTGTAHFVDQGGVTRNISFVLVNRAAECFVGASPQSSTRQELDFVFNDPGVFGGGSAQLE